MSDRAFDHLSGLSPQDRALVDQQLEVFERAWESGSPPELADYLSVDERIRLPLLVELVQIDRERRIKRGEQAPLGSYRLRFPELAAWIEHDRSLNEMRATATFSQDSQPPLEQPGTTIGPYQLVEQIGAGGFGLVFVAEQRRPVRRKVALKVIKPGMDTREVVARFEAERQALALMDHTNIARVIDGGTTDSGRPYFVMELVRGIPIIEYCDKHHLALRERLSLFVSVCEGVQHAHQKGIVHRDIKPSNVLVTEQDGKPVVKVIDFGIAKALYQPLTEKTIHTQFAQMIGTPLYMSPEQAEIGALDIDTRSDIYSLGVLLYELLTGTTPLDPKRLVQAAYDELLRIIRQEEPPRPSNRLSSLGDTATNVATSRGMDVKHLSQLLSGDLDWVVMKALEKDRNRRYETAGNFADDIERYLSNETVTARPPSALYRLNKFARRNRVAVLAGAVVAATLVAGTVVSTWEALRAIRAEKDAIAAADTATRAGEAARAAALSESKAKDEALGREAETKAVLEFVENRIFTAASPEREAEGLGRKVTLRKALESSVPYLDKGFPGQPLIEARLRWSLSKLFGLLGDPEKAAEQAEAARALYAATLSPDHPETLKAMNSLAADYGQLGRLRDAARLHEQILAIRRAKLGPDDPETLKTMHNLAVDYNGLARYDEALKVNEEALARSNEKLGTDHPTTLDCMTTKAASYHALGRIVDCMRLTEETLSLEKSKFGNRHPHTLLSMHNLATCYSELGRYSDALKLQEETLALRKAILGADHPETLTTMNNLARTYIRLGRYADATTLDEQTLTLRKAKLGASHPSTLVSMASLAESYSVLGRHAEALKVLEEAFRLSKAKLGPDHRRTLQTMHQLAEELLALNRPGEAITLIDECVQRAAGRAVHASFLPTVIETRLHHFEKAKDASGCRQTALMWEKLKRADCNSLYNAACYRAVTAGVFRASDKAASEADTEGNQAMAWLKQAVAAGYKDVALMKKDKDLDALRGREDFKKLVADLVRVQDRHTK